MLEIGRPQVQLQVILVKCFSNNLTELYASCYGRGRWFYLKLNLKEKWFGPFILAPLFPHEHQEVWIQVVCSACKHLDVCIQVVDLGLFVRMWVKGCQLLSPPYICQVPSGLAVISCFRLCSSFACRGLTIPSHLCHQKLFTVLGPLTRVSWKATSRLQGSWWPTYLGAITACCLHKISTLSFPSCPLHELDFLE